MERSRKISPKCGAGARDIGGQVIGFKLGFSEVRVTSEAGDAAAAEHQPEPDHGEPVHGERVRDVIRRGAEQDQKNDRKREEREGGAAEEAEREGEAEEAHVPLAARALGEAILATSDQF